MEQIDDIQSYVAAELNDEAREVAIKVWRELILTTPVDTGRARRGWIPTAEEPSDETPEPGEYSVPALPDVPRVDDPEGTQYWVVNNVPYIARLDEGHSKQAPANFVQTAIDRVVSGNG